MQHINRICQVLKKGSRRCGKAKAIIDLSINHQRKDPLIKYVHQARNAEHHGLEQSVSPLFAITSGFVDKISVKGGQIDMDEPNREAEIYVSFSLIPVVDDRYDDIHHPPWSI